MDNSKNNTGDFLKSLRMAKGLTQIELAEYLNVSNKTVSKWENGIGIPEVTTLIILADFYDVTVDDILRGSKRISKNIEKEKNISLYIISKCKSQYRMLLIITIGIWLLSNVLMVMVGQLTHQKDLGVGLGIVAMLIGLILQGVNINHIKSKISSMDVIERRKMYQIVFNTSSIIFYLCFATALFAGFYVYGHSIYIKQAYHQWLFAYSLSAIYSMIFYYVIRLFKISFLNKLKMNFMILSGILFMVLSIPLIIIMVIDPYQLAIKTNSSHLSYSYYKKDMQTDKYYQLKYLSSLNDMHVDDKLQYDEKTHEFIYLFDDGYELRMSNEVFSFITTLDYIKFEITKYDAKGYMIQLSKFETGMALYSDFVRPLVIIYGLTVLIYFMREKRKKQ